MSTPTIRVEKADEWDQEGWTSVPNALIRDTELDPDGKWAYSWCASHSKEFIFRADDLAAAGPKGRNHARESIRKCEKAGWMTRRKEHDPATGRITGTVYRLHPRPVAAELRTYVESTAKKKPFPRPNQNASSDPAPRIPGAGTFAPRSQVETPRSDPATGNQGAGYPGAGQPVTGHPVVPIDEEKIRGEDQLLPPSPPQSGGDTNPAVEPSPLDVDLAVGIRRASRRRQSFRELNRYAHTVTAKRIVESYADTCNIRPPKEVFLALAVQVDSMLKQSYPEHVISQALTELGRKGFHPSTLPSFVNAVANRSDTPDRRPARSEQQFAQLQELKQQYLAEEESPFGSGLFAAQPATLAIEGQVIDQ